MRGGRRWETDGGVGGKAGGEHYQKKGDTVQLSGKTLSAFQTTPQGILHLETSAKISPFWWLARIPPFLRSVSRKKNEKKKLLNNWTARFWLCVFIASNVRWCWSKGSVVKTGLQWSRCPDFGVFLSATVTVWLSKIKTRQSAVLLTLSWTPTLTPSNCSPRGTVSTFSFPLSATRSRCLGQTVQSSQTNARCSPPVPPIN